MVYCNALNSLPIATMSFTRDDIIYLLRRLSTLAKADGVTLEVAFYGGSCLLLAYDYQDRQLT